MSDKETIKYKIRELALESVSLSVDIKVDAHNSPLVSKILLEKKITELMSIIDIASVSGTISSMNSSILNKEFESFLEVLSKVFESTPDSIGLISKDFFSEPALSASSAPYQYRYTENTIKDKMSKPDVSFRDKSNRKNQRNKEILELITKKGIVSIKDLSLNIKGCSEKTLQRELIAMIKEGLVTKVGERRWSKYSVA